MAQSGYKVGDIPNPLKRNPKDAPIILPPQPSLGDVAKGMQEPEPEPISPIQPRFIPNLDAVFGGLRREDLPEEGAQSRDQILAALQSLLGR